jgi:hypothetical protein
MLDATSLRKKLSFVNFAVFSVLFQVSLDRNKIGPSQLEKLRIGMVARAPEVR